MALPAEDDPYLIYLASLGPQSRRVMAGRLDAIAQLLVGVGTLPGPGGEPVRVTGRGMPWWQLRYAHVVAVRSFLLERGLAPASVNLHLVALRRVLKESWRLGHLSGEDYQRAAAVPGVTGTRLPAGRALADRELAGLLAACPAGTPAGARDAAVLATLYTSGVRRGELAALDLNHVDAAERSLRVQGKGDRERFAYITEDAAALLDRWLAARGRAPGPLFCAVDRWQTVHPSRRLSGQAVHALLRRRATAARLRPTSPHDLRRSFITDLLDAGVDVLTAQRLAGHASPATTGRYDRRPERAKRAAVDRLHLPTSTRGPGRAAAPSTDPFRPTGESFSGQGTP